MRLLQPLAVASIAIVATNCALLGNLGNVGNFCQERPGLCVLTAAAIVGGIVWAVSDSGGSSYNSLENSESVSDARLKRDIHQVGDLPNGIKTYAFRYWNDDRYFIGVLAQEVLANPRYAHAVVTDESGYYKVNLAAIGVRFEGDREAFEAAGRGAIEGL